MVKTKKRNEVFKFRNYWAVSVSCALSKIATHYCILYRVYTLTIDYQWSLPTFSLNVWSLSLNWYFLSCESRGLIVIFGLFIFGLSRVTLLLSSHNDTTKQTQKTHFSIGSGRTREVENRLLLLPLRDKSTDCRAEGARRRRCRAPDRASERLGVRHTVTQQDLTQK